MKHSQEQEIKNHKAGLVKSQPFRRDGDVNYGTVVVSGEQGGG